MTTPRNPTIREAFPRELPLSSAQPKAGELYDPLEAITGIPAPGKPDRADDFDYEMIERTNQETEGHPRWQCGGCGAYNVGRTFGPCSVCGEGPDDLECE